MELNVDSKPQISNFRPNLGEGSLFSAQPATFFRITLLPILTRASSSTERNNTITAYQINNAIFGLETSNPNLAHENFSPSVSISRGETLRVLI